MRRPLCRVAASLWVVPAVLTLFSLTLAVPASADTVTPVRRCPAADRSYGSDGATSATVAAPAGYLIASFCVETRSRRTGAEVRQLSAPQSTVVVRHSSGRPMEGYSVGYVRSSPPVDDPGDDEDEDEGEGEEGDEGAEDEGQPEPEKSAEAEETRRADSGEKAPSGERSRAPERQEPERTPSASASAPAPSASAAVGSPWASESPSRLAVLGADGEELKITSFEKDDHEDDRRAFLVAGGIIVVGLLAGGIALLVRLPGQR